MTCPYTADQVRSALVQAIRDGEPEELKVSLARILAVQYPEEFERLQLVLDVARSLDA